MFQIAANVRASISGLTITGGFTYYAAVDDLGTLNLTSCTVSGNIGVGYAGLDGQGTPAGGLYIKGSATVSDCTFSDNNGNGLYNAGTALISDCTFTGNYAIGKGGGVGSDGNTTLTDCTITGNFAGFGAGVYDKGTLTVTGCTINNNGTSSKPVPASIAGSGVFEKGTGKLYDSTISGNYAGTGTGVYNDGSLTVANCTISGNSADGSGGGVWNEAGTASFTDCTITGNTTPFYGGDLGNRFGGTLELTDCLVTAGSANTGGGVYSAGIATLTDCTISGNSVSDGGGGISTGYLQPYPSILNVVNSTISGNSSGLGGGGVSNSGTATLTDCTIANNSGNTGNQGFLYSGGGGINNGGDATLVACTVTGNNISNEGGSVFTEGGGGIYDGGGGSKKLTLNDTIVSGNTNTTSSGTSSNDISAEYSAIVRGTAIVAGSYNLYGTYYLNGTNLTGSLVGSNNIVMGSMSNPAALGLAPLADYGGPTETMALLPGSLAIGNGSQALEVDANGNPLTGDQRGFAFDSPNPDIGAYQDLLFPLVVSVATDGVGALFRRTRLARRRQHR